MIRGDRLRLDAGRGQPLPEDLRPSLEQFFRADFSAVRVHTTLQARTIGAHAFTHGHDIYFAPGMYQPGTPPGRQLLAHELAHVVQQRSGRVPIPPTRPGEMAVVQHPGLEAEADRLGWAAAHHLQRQSAGAAVQARLGSSTPTSARPAGNPPTPASRGSSPAIVQPGRTRRVSKAGTDRELKKFTKPSRVTFTGRWSSRVGVSGSRSFKIERGAQMLRQISAQIYWYVKEKLGQNKEQEVQSMLVNERILVAANLDSSMQSLSKDLKIEVGRYASDVARREAGHATVVRQHPFRRMLVARRPGDLRATGYGRKLSGVFSGSRLVGEIKVAPLLATVATSDFFRTLNASNATDCRTVITDPGHKNKVIFVTSGGGKVHAEQKLLRVLVQSGYSGSAEIYGKKRPCVGCYLTLCFARDKLGKQISFNTHPGGYWSTALPELVRLAQDAIKGKSLDHAEALQWLHDKAVSLKTYQTQPLKSGTLRSSMKYTEEDFTSGGDIDVDRTGYDTASDSEDDLW